MTSYNYYSCAKQSGKNTRGIIEAPEGSTIICATESQKIILKNIAELQGKKLKIITMEEANKELLKNFPKHMVHIDGSN